jgi:hypothetical protein
LHQIIKLLCYVVDVMVAGVSCGGRVVGRDWENLEAAA